MINISCYNGLQYIIMAYSYGRYIPMVDIYNYNNSGTITMVCNYHNYGCITINIASMVYNIAMYSFYGLIKTNNIQLYM